MLREIVAGIATLIGTRDEVFLLTGSGSGALEASVVNTLSPGDRVLAVVIGGFGERFAAIAEAFGASVERLEVPWGEAADPAAVAARLAERPPYRAVLLTHNETSTGVTNPLRELATVVHGAPGRPPGPGRRHQRPWCAAVRDGRLAHRSRGERKPEGVDGFARDRHRRGRRPCARRGRRRRACPASTGISTQARRWAEKGQTPWTPAVSVLFGLRVGRPPAAAGRTRADLGTARSHHRRGERRARARRPPPRGTTRASAPTRLPPRGFPTASNGRRSTSRCAPGAWSSPAGRASGRGESFASATWATSTGQPIGDALGVLAMTLAEFGYPADAEAVRAAGHAAFESAAAAP